MTNAEAHHIICMTCIFGRGSQTEQPSACNTNVNLMMTLVQTKTRLQPKYSACVYTATCVEMNGFLLTKAPTKLCTRTVCLSDDFSAFLKY